MSESTATSPFEGLLAMKLTAPRSRSDAFGIVHRSPSPNEVWRISYFDELGPVGHSPRATVEDVLKTAREDGYVTIESIVTRDGTDASASQAATAILTPPRQSYDDLDELFAA